MKQPPCACKSIPPEEIQKIRSGVPKEADTLRMAEFFKVFGDGSRLKILYFLSRHELCVADLAALAQMQQSAVSHQLKLLRLHRLVKTRKEGVTVYYSLDDKHIESIFEVAHEHINES